MKKILILFLEYRELLLNFLFWICAQQSIPDIIVRRGQRGGRFLLGLGGERDLGVEQAADDADGQPHKVSPREEIVASYYHTWKKKRLYSKYHHHRMTLKGHVTCRTSIANRHRRLRPFYFNCTFC